MSAEPPASGLRISQRVVIPENEIRIQAVAAQGAGGQNVNKVATAIHLFFDVAASSLPDYHKQRLQQHADHRITSDGTVVIKAQEHRTQEKNREAARARLAQLIREATAPRKKRRATRPSRAAKERRIEKKKRRGRTKALRRRPER